MNKQTGFTLIELIIVIVILGVLSAIAVPRFVNLEDNAQEAALSANAAAISSAMNINYAGCAVSNHITGTDCVEVNSCGDAGVVLRDGIPASFEVVADTAITGANGTTGSCNLRRTGTTTPTKAFTAVKAGTP